MGIIERAAEAAKQALIDDPETEAYMRADDRPDDFLIDGNIRLTPVVRAILTAIREPSEAMVAAGSDIRNHRRWK